MRRFVAGLAALSLAACNQAPTDSTAGTLSNGLSESSASAAPTESSCPGQNTMTLNDMMGNYNMLVSDVVRIEHPNAPAGITRHIIANQDIGVKFVMIDGKCTAKYAGSTYFEGSSYRFSGTCRIEPDGQFEGANDWKPVIPCDGRVY